MILNKKELLNKISLLKKEEKKIVTTSGCFDLLHPGHLDFLKKAKNEGDILIILLNNDDSIKKLKGPERPIMNEQDRAELLDNLNCVDYVHIFSDEKPLELIAMIMPDVHVKGGSWECKNIEEEEKLLNSFNSKFKTFGMKDNHSTTNIIKKIKGEIETKIGLDLTKIKTNSIRERKSLVSIKDFAKLPKGSSFSSFLECLSSVGQRTNAGSDFLNIIEAIKKAKANNKAIIWALGPHVVKYGLSPLIIDLMKRGYISAIAFNGAGAIHDCEIGLFGETSEEMTGRIHSGDFGMAKETGDFLNNAAKFAAREGKGYGATIGELLQGSDFQEYSILSQAYRLKIPITVHVAIGTDIIHMHPSMDGAATGKATYTDFKILADNIKDIGVHLNICSTVILPEVFLKCLTIAKNLGYKLEDFTTCTIDHESKYRPLMNVVRRPTKDFGTGYELLGRVEIILPLLHIALIN